ncbi:hypothetical protein HT576_07090 [Haloterrigena sp. SYSU A121-1]|uniref:DUF7511 domain-containing protein n=1 Tax=Haloterrigena gelatinilytica TaxID=2741724 RepID=A0A8J8GJH0_9EURY|nr:hypothetical protein [Haloterrigena gelatinilytica]NUB90786.1 hypothetical protein [Haloterrigena gelatinilytica]
MTERESDTDAETVSEEATSPDPQPADGEISPCYKAYVEHNDDRPDVCTIYSDVTSGDVEETWVRAIGSAFASRDDVR